MDRRIPLAIGAGLTLVLAAVVYCWRAKVILTNTHAQCFPRDLLPPPPPPPWISFVNDMLSRIN